MIYVDPPFNTGKAQARTDAAGGARRRRRAHRLPGPALHARGCWRVALQRRLRGLPGVPGAAPGAGAPAAGARGHALLPHRLPRGAPLQAAARRDLRARLLPQRDHLGVRLRRRAAKRRWPAKHDTILVYVKDPGRVLLRLRGGGPRAVHGARPGHAREGRPRQAPDGCVVAHDRAHQRAREDGLPDAEAGGDRAPHGAAPPRGPATGAWTSSPAAARSARWPRSSAAATS